MHYSFCKPFWKIWFLCWYYMNCDNWFFRWLRLFFSYDSRLYCGLYGVCIYRERPISIMSPEWSIDKSTDKNRDWQAVPVLVSALIKSKWYHPYTHSNVLSAMIYCNRIYTEWLVSQGCALKCDVLPSLTKHQKSPRTAFWRDAALHLRQHQNCPSPPKGSSTSSNAHSGWSTTEDHNKSSSSISFLVDNVKANIKQRTCSK